MTQIHEQLATAAREAARLADGVDPARLAGATPCPDYDVRALAAHLLQEIVLHGWDLAAATGQTPEFPDEIAATVLDRLDHERAADQDGEWYGGPVPAPGPSLLDQAVARSGRDPDWRPAGR
ncbi:MAG: maleylpyruvate isomerase N-terminal domain-containing protein [Nocardiopsaceae bacterium]|nr:maleylpyruvate isomerase N-terminal domain-containing protein [Nocardiopsaceae bacterium]